MLLLCFGALMLAGVGVVCQSCDKFTQSINDSWVQPKDSAEFVKLLASHLPAAMQKVYEFDDVRDVIYYKHERQRQEKVDSIFTSLSDQTIANVVSVLSKRKRSYSISDITSEYLASKTVYDGLPNPEQEAPLPSKEQELRDSIIELTHYTNKVEL